jgi:hypothetical protein
MEVVLNSGPYRTFVGDFEVLTDGTVHISSERPLHVMLNDLKVEFTFHTDSANLSQRVSYTAVQQKTLTINIYNFNNSFGTGILDPVKIGTLSDRELFCTFFVWTPSLAEGMRIVNYVFYIRAKK